MANEKIEIKDKIISFLKKMDGEPTTSKLIQEELKISYPTLMKYLAVLKAEGRIRVSDFGNIKFYYLSENEEKKK